MTTYTAIIIDQMQVTSKSLNVTKPEDKQYQTLLDQLTLLSTLLKRFLDEEADEKRRGEVTQ